MAQPNIVLIMSDQHRGDFLGIEGHRSLLTPNLDNLAASGAWFSRAYSTCPTCIAARRSMLSGQFPRTHGLVGYAENQYWDAPPALPEVLRDAGYHTYFVGRSMHQYPKRRRFGYDHMVINEDYRDWVSHRIPYETGHEGGELYPDSIAYSYGTMHNDYTAHPWTYDEQLHFTNWTMMQAKRFMRIRDPGQPFFLTISFAAPHQPLSPPAFYFERYLRQELPDPAIGDWAVRPENDGIGLEANGVGQDGKPRSTKVCLEGELKRNAMAGYYGSINHNDDQIRRLIYGINGIDFSNTAVLYVADHGEMLGDHYFWRKSLPYEASARVPFIVRLPNGVKTVRGQRFMEPVCLEDLMPTILDIAGAPIPDTVEGRSLLPLIQGTVRSLNRPYLHIEHAPIHQSLTDGRIKYIWFVDDGVEQLFDLVRDPHELHDCIGDAAYKDTAALWRSRLIKELAARPEGFVANGQLVAGRPYPAVLSRGTA
jgi:arylsulfatase